jgi:hypothetical protein
VAGEVAQTEVAGIPLLSAMESLLVASRFLPEDWVVLVHDSEREQLVAHLRLSP